MYHKNKIEVDSSNKKIKSKFRSKMIHVINETKIFDNSFDRSFN